MMQEQIACPPNVPQYPVYDPRGADVDVAPQFRAQPVFSLRNMIYKQMGILQVDPAITDPFATQRLLMPFPAQQVTDWFSFFYGAPTHGLTLRPRNPTECCWPSQYEFDVASGMSVPAYGQATMSVPPAFMKYLFCLLPSFCSSFDPVWCEQRVEVQFGGNRPPMRGTFRQCCFDTSVCAPSTKIQWESGEEAKFLPLTQSWVGSIPGEENRGSVRYLQGPMPGLCNLVFYWCPSAQKCNCQLDQLCVSCHLCFPATCGSCNLQQCSFCAATHINRVTGVPKSQNFFRDAVLESYHIKYRSKWMNQTNLGMNNEPREEHVEENLFPNDINGIGNYRIHIERNGFCTKFIDATSAASVEEATAIDMWFRGSKNQHAIEESDLNIMLALSLLHGYELLRNGPTAAALLGVEGEVRPVQRML